MNTDLSWRQRSRLALTALDVKLEQSSWMPKAEFPVVAITAPILVVLVVLLGNALALPLTLNLAAATILALGLVSPFMRRGMHSSTPTETDGTRFTARILRVTDVPSYSGVPDYEGLFGQMANFNSDELDFLADLVEKYFDDNDDLSQREWGFAKGVQDKIDEAILNG